MRLFLIFLSLGCSLFAENKMVYMFSTPRSMSTMFVRMMHSRGDFIIYNEPTVAIFGRENFMSYSKDWEFEDNFKDFAEVKESFGKSLNKGNVFVKELSFTAFDPLIKAQDAAFFQDPSKYFVFLVRDPHEVLLSIYDKVGTVEPNLTTLCGFFDLLLEYRVVKRLSPNKPFIILSDELCENPRKVMKEYCEYLDIPFLESMFDWKDLGEDFDLHRDWHEQKREHITAHWHKRAFETHRVGKKKEYKVDKEGKPTFEEVENLQDRSKLKFLYEQVLWCYKHLKEARINSC